MDVAAFVLALVAMALFVLRPVHLGLLVLTGALVCQYVHLTGHLIHVN